MSRYWWIIYTDAIQIDATKSVISWIQTKQCSLIDLNIFPRPASSKGEVCNPASYFCVHHLTAIQIPSAKFSEEIMTYIWDNYIEYHISHHMRSNSSHSYISLSECQEVVFLAFGTACSSMMYLVNHRGRARLIGGR